MHETTRAPAVAGRFYPDSPAALSEAIDGFIAQAALPSAVLPKALIVPHAGYAYSGPIAGSAYATIAAHRGQVRRVVLLGPAHRVALRGLARPGATHLGTPLGSLRVDERLDRLVPWVPVSAAAHAEEHSLEVQLPFLHRLLGPETTVAPFVVGDARPAEVARVLEALWGGKETLIVVSSDLSHYLPDAVAQRVDEATAQAIVAQAPHLSPERACGARAIEGLLEVARGKGLQIVLLDRRTSGDTVGPRDEVVGYGAFALYEPSTVQEVPSDEERGRVLIGLARRALERVLGVPGAVRDDPRLDPPWLRALGATFVTLRDPRGDLHGCIGTLEAHRPLGEDVRRNAVAAAVEDPRAPEVGPEAAAGLSIEVSVLGPLVPLEVSSREELLKALRPGEDGVLLSAGGHRGTFLPQVWKDLPNPEDFLAELERKAGLPRGFWSPDVRVFRYGVTKYVERGVP